MTYQDIFKLFGYSEFSPEAKELLLKLHIPLDRPKVSISWRRFQSKKWDLSLTFKRKYDYKNDYGAFVKEYTSDFDECFFEEIDFGGTEKGDKYPHTLPYNLKWGDEKDMVLKKMPLRKSSSNTASYGSNMIFNLENYWLLTAFDIEKKLIWLRIQLHQKSFIRKRELIKSLKEQNKNLIVLNANDFKPLMEKSPIVAWTKQMKKGDNNFTIKNIADSNYLLKAFFDNLFAATKQKKANLIYSATRKVTQGFNKLNDQNQTFIETLERENLIDYIHDAIRMTGFKIDTEVDLTEEWREW